MHRGRHAHPGGGLLPERPPSRTGVRLQGTAGPRPPGGAGHRPGEPHEVRAWLHGCVRQARVSRSLGASPEATCRVGPSGAGRIKHPQADSASGGPGAEEAAALPASARGPGPAGGWAQSARPCRRADCHRRAHRRPAPWCWPLTRKHTHTAVRPPLPLQALQALLPPGAPMGHLAMGAGECSPSVHSLPSFKTVFLLFCL